MIVCVVISDFVMALERETVPDAAVSSLVIYERHGHIRRVYAMSEEVKRAGVTIGMARTHVRPLCPEAEERDATLKHYEQVAQSLCEALLAVSGRIEYEQSDSLSIWLDSGDFSSEDIGSSIVQTIQPIISTTPLIGIAQGRRTARIAALTGKRGNVHSITPGTEKRFLAPMLLSSFAIDKKLKEQFDEVGLKTLAHLAALSPAKVKKRFGTVGLELHCLAQGMDRQEVNWYVVAERLERSYPFDTPVEDRSIIETVLSHLSADLSASLVKQSLTCSEIALTIQCDDKRALEASRTLREPIQTEKVITQELTNLLSKIKLESGIMEVDVLLDRLTPPGPVQVDFFALFESEPTPSVTIAEKLLPRHPASLFQRVTLAPSFSYLPERNVRLESVVAA